jgi:hypothetical protein
MVKRRLGEFVICMLSSRRRLIAMLLCTFGIARCRHLGQPLMMSSRTQRRLSRGHRGSFRPFSRSHGVDNLGRSISGCHRISPPQPLPKFAQLADPSLDLLRGHCRRPIHSGLTLVADSWQARTGACPIHQTTPD